MNKINQLKKILKNMHSVLVAYSGGLDSTFLLAVSKEVLGKNVLAVTANSATYPRQELKSAKKTARKLKARHLIINSEELKDKRYLCNSTQRCYFCKKDLFRRLKKIAAGEKIKFVIEASNLNDAGDFRPGRKAKKEYLIRSPLEEAHFSKADIRRYSKKLGLNTWNKPSLACLASRIPYGTKINRNLLKRINKAEEYLYALGIRQVRLRHYNGLCRIEVEEKDFPTLIKKRNSIVEKLKKLGYNYITLDLEGYRTGSLNEVING